jgi:MFS family permease
VATNSPDLADIIGIYNVTLFSAALMTIMSFVWLACGTKVSCIILVIIMGIAGGAFVSLQAPLATKTATDMRFGGTMVGQALCKIFPCIILGLPS